MGWPRRSESTITIIHHPIALVKNGDTITIDAEKRELTLCAGARSRPMKPVFERRKNLARVTRTGQAEFDSIFSRRNEMETRLVGFGLQTPIRIGSRRHA